MAKRARRCKSNDRGLEIVDCELTVNFIVHQFHQFSLFPEISLR